MQRWWRRRGAAKSRQRSRTLGWRAKVELEKADATRTPCAVRTRDGVIATLLNDAARNDDGAVLCAVRDRDAAADAAPKFVPPGDLSWLPPKKKRREKRPRPKHAATPTAIAHRPSPRPGLKDDDDDDDFGDEDASARAADTPAAAFHDGGGDDDDRDSDRPPDSHGSNSSDDLSDIEALGSFLEI